MNMLHLSVRSGSEKARIWQIADEMAASTGRIPSGRDVVAAYVGEGGNSGTGYTQYSHWKKEFEKRQAQQDDESTPVQSSPGSVPFRPMTVAPDGTLVIPLDLRKAMLLDADGRVTASVIDGELRIISPMSAVHQLQRRAASLVPPGTLVSDELVAERREEAARHG